MQRIIAILVFLLIGFVVQSLFVIVYKNIIIRLIPSMAFAALLVRFSMIHDANSIPTNLWPILLIPLAIGCIVGYFVGLKLREVLVKEYRELMARYKDILGEDDE